MGSLDRAPARTAQMLGHGWVGPSPRHSKASMCHPRDGRMQMKAQREGSKRTDRLDLAGAVWLQATGLSPQQRVAQRTWLPPVTPPPAPALHFSAPNLGSPGEQLGRQGGAGEGLGVRLALAPGRRPGLLCKAERRKQKRGEGLGRSRFHLKQPHSEQHCLAPAF